MDNFKALYLAGKIDFEEIDEYSYQWGMSDDERTLAQYLGLNADEEDAWVSVGEDALRELLDKQKNHQTVAASIEKQTIKTAARTVT